MQQQSDKRLKALFEHCCGHTIKNSAEVDFTKSDTGEYKSKRTEDLYSLWLTGHAQGVVDHAVQRGDVQL